MAARLADLNGEAQRLLGVFSNAGAPSKLMVERLGELEAQMDRVCLDLAAIEAWLRTADRVRHEVERVTEFLDSFDGLWDVLVPEERREFLHTLVRRVYVDSATRQLRVNFFDFMGLSQPGAVAAAEVAA